MTGIKPLRKIQLGRETTAGTAVAATTIWRGLGVIDDQREVVFANEDVGLISRTDRAYTPKYAAAIQMESVEATFEQLPHIFEAGIKAVGTGVTDTGGSGKVYTYPFPTTAKNTIKTYTVEGGDDQQAEEMEYSFVESFTLEGNAGEALMASANWMGRQVSLSTFSTAGVTLPDVEDILASKGKLYIDPVSGTIGTTQVSETLLNMSLNVTTGWKAVHTQDGNLYFSFAKITEPEITLDLTFEHNASAVTEKAAWRAGTPRLIRLKYEGSALTTAGTFANKTLIIDLAGKWESFDPLDDDDGNDVVSGTFRARYNSTAAFFAQIKVVNQLATIP
jgi:hypothetical protein